MPAVGPGMRATGETRRVSTTISLRLRRLSAARRRRCSSDRVLVLARAISSSGTTHRYGARLLCDCRRGRRHGSPTRATELTTLNRRQLANLTWPTSTSSDPQPPVAIPLHGGPAGPPFTLARGFVNAAPGARRTSLTTPLPRDPTATPPPLPYPLDTTSTTTAIPLDPASIRTPHPVHPPFTSPPRRRRTPPTPPPNPPLRLARLNPPLGLSVHNLGRHVACAFRSGRHRGRARLGELRVVHALFHGRGRALAGRGRDRLPQCRPRPSQRLHRAQAFGARRPEPLRRLPSLRGLRGARRPGGPQAFGHPPMRHDPGHRPLDGGCRPARRSPPFRRGRRRSRGHVVLRLPSPQ